MRVKGRPGKWRQDPGIHEAYEECGRSIGRAIAHDKTREAYFWSMLGGLKLWPRWYLLAFVTLWREENPVEAKRIKQQQGRARKRERILAGKMEETREQAERRLTAHPQADSATDRH